MRQDAFYVSSEKLSLCFIKKLIVDFKEHIWLLIIVLHAIVSQLLRISRRFFNEAKTYFCPAKAWQMIIVAALLTF